MSQELTTPQAQVLSRLRIHAHGAIMRDPDDRRWRTIRIDVARPAGMATAAFRTAIVGLQRAGVYRPLDAVWDTGEVLLAPEPSIVETAAALDDVVAAQALITAALKLPPAHPGAFMLMEAKRWGRMEQWARVSAIADFIAYRIKSQLIKRAPLGTPAPMQTVGTND